MQWLSLSEVTRAIKTDFHQLPKLISVGIIDTKPLKTKEGRRISTKSELNSLDPPRLLEVIDPNAPNVLTNDPNFFENDYPPKNAGLIFC